MARSGRVAASFSFFLLLISLLYSTTAFKCRPLRGSDIVQRLFQGALALHWVFLCPFTLMPSNAKEPLITSKVKLDLNIGTSTKQIKSIDIGIFGNEAPSSSKVFLSVCGGENSWDGLSYDLAQVSRIVKDQRIDFGKFSKGRGQKQEKYIDSVGKMRIRNVNVAENTANFDENELRHISGGEVSMRRGGGSFDFTIAPRPNADLDKGNIIMGKVIEGMDVIEEINGIPTSREDILGTKQAFSNAGKAFDGRAKLAAVGKPLKRVRILSCTVDDKASLASFLQF